MSSNIAENKSKLDATAFRQIHSTKKVYRYFQIEISTKINMQIDILFFLMAMNLFWFLDFYT